MIKALLDLKKYSTTKQEQFIIYIGMPGIIKSTNLN